MATKRRPDAEDLLRMAEHRRSMRALQRVSSSAAQLAASAAPRHLQLVNPSVTNKELADTDNTIVSLAAERARRAGHPAGSGRNTLA